MIKVGKKWDKGAIYIGRGSPLGNPFVMKDQSQAERDRVCDEYEAWLRAQIKAHNEVVTKEIRRIKEISREHDVTLGCFCAPKRCHGDFIKYVLESLK